MIKTSIKICKSCKYGKVYNSNEYHCDYYLMTGKRRNCKVGECDKYEKKEKKHE